MAFNILPGLGPEHYEDRINNRKGVSPFRIPGFFGRFLNTFYQLALALFGAAALSMRLFFRQKNGHETIKPWSFLFCIFYLRIFFGDIWYTAPTWPKLYAFTSWETLFDWDTFMYVPGDLWRLAWFFFLLAASIIYFIHRLFVGFNHEGFADIFVNGFPETFTYSQKIYFVFVCFIIISGLGLFARKFAFRRNAARFGFERHRSSRGESVFFHWAGEKIGQNLDIFLIALIAWSFFEYGNPLIGWFFAIGAFALFYEDKMYGDYMHRVAGPTQNMFSPKKSRRKFGDVVSI